MPRTVEILTSAAALGKASCNYMPAKICSHKCILNFYKLANVPARCPTLPATVYTQTQGRYSPLRSSLHSHRHSLHLLYGHLQDSAGHFKLFRIPLSHNSQPVF